MVAVEADAYFCLCKLLEGIQVRLDLTCSPSQQTVAGF